jgi:hypothetical protein
MKYLLLTLIALSGCGKSPNQIDPTFQPLYDQFVSDAKSNGVDVSGPQGIVIQFTTLEQANPLGETIGECSDMGYGNDIVSIDYNFWAGASPSTQQILLYHELGHCLLDEHHNPDPTSIMNALINNTMTYWSNYEARSLQILFSQEGNNG